MADHHVDFSILTNNFGSRHFKAGDVIFSAGETGRELFIVKSGEVEIRRNGKVLETVGEQGVFGEMAVIDGSPRSAGAFGKTDGEVVPLTQKQFLFLIGETPHFALNLMRVMSQRLRETTAARG